MRHRSRLLVAVSCMTALLIAYCWIACLHKVDFTSDTSIRYYRAIRIGDALIDHASRYGRLPAASAHNPSAVYWIDAVLRHTSSNWKRRLCEPLSPDHTREILRAYKLNPQLAERQWNSLVARSTVELVGEADFVRDRRFVCYANGHVVIMARRHLQGAP